MLVPDRPEVAALQLALHLLGCRTVWIATYALPPDQAAFIRLARANVLIYDPAMMQRARFMTEPGVLSAGSAPLRAFSFGAVDTDGAVGDGADLLAAVQPLSAALRPELIGPEPQSLFYSGGTTGTPKLVRHGQGFYQTLLAIAACYCATGEPPMRFLSGSSFTHVSGQMPAFLTLFEGGTLFVGHNSSAAEFLSTVERERISSTFLTPALLYEVIDHPLTAATDTSSLRYLNVGGAAASPARLAAAIDCFGPVVRLVYGSSEVPLITDLPFLDHDLDHRNGCARAVGRSRMRGSRSAMMKVASCRSARLARSGSLARADRGCHRQSSAGPGSRRDRRAGC